MKSRDFVYWLQGYFELAKPVELSTDALILIRRHLDMVKVHEGRNTSSIVSWLDGVLSHVPANIDELSLRGAFAVTAPTDLIRDRLADEFIHVIDPSFPLNQQGALSEAHQGKPRETSAVPGLVMGGEALFNC